MEKNLTADHVKDVCRPNAGPATCKYLQVGPQGLTCGKVEVHIAAHIESLSNRGLLGAHGDNCDGRFGAVNPIEVV